MSKYQYFLPAKDRLQAKSIFEGMIANRQQADLASAAYIEAWDRGDHWIAATRKSLVAYDDDFRRLLRTELAKGAVELRSDPAD